MNIEEALPRPIEEHDQLVIDSGLETFYFFGGHAGLLKWLVFEDGSRAYEEFFSHGEDIKTVVADFFKKVGVTRSETAEHNGIYHFTVIEKNERI